MSTNAYILCMGRSGSTLLQQMLNQHPEVVAPPETYFVLHLLERYGHITNWTTSIKSDFIQDVFTDRQLRLIWKVSKPKLRQVLLDAPSPLTFGDVCNITRSCFDEEKSPKSINVFIDKNPIYAFFIDRLLSIHPRTKIIHLIRDPRGVINGQVNTFKKSDILTMGYLWSIRNVTIEKASKQSNVDYLQVFYEDLVSDPEITLKSICTFLGIAFSSQMLKYNESVTSFYKKQSSTVTNKHLSSLQPLNKSIADKWKKNLSKDQLRKISFSTHSLAQLYGYQIEPIKGDLSLKISLFKAKIKSRIKLSFVRLSFAIPFSIRKIIMAIRSKLFDHRYD